MVAPFHSQAKLERCGLALTLAAACLGCSGLPGGESLGEQRHPIVGGEATVTCSWPTAVHFITKLGGNSQAECTATLVHPKMVSVAAHCVDEGTPTEIHIGDTRDHDDPGRSVGIKSCLARPGGVDAGEDFAYCILDEEVNDVSIIPILYGCELDFLKEGATAALVGFGNVDNDNPAPGGHKRWVEAPVVEVKQKTVDVGDEGHANCFGDSGGPAYLKLPDGSWRVFGATSTSYVIDNVACLREGTWAFTSHYVPWIEETSGLDVTPCYDSEGNWESGPDCTRVPLNPEESTGTWPGMCRETEKLSGPLSTCGSPIDFPSNGGSAGAGGSGGAAGGAGLGGGGAGGLGGSGGSAGSGGAGGGLGGSAGSAGAGGGVETSGGSAGSASGPVGGSLAGGAPPGIQTSSNSGDVEGDCACRVPSGPSSSRAAFALLGLALAGLSRRRRR